MQIITGKNKLGYVSNGSIKFVFTDRISVFDKIAGEISERGVLLATCTRTVFSYLMKNDIPTALISGHKNVITMKKCVPLDFEFIVRNYLTGSALLRAKKGLLKLPKGMICEEYAKFPTPFIEVSTKRELHDRYNLKKREIEDILAKSFPMIPHHDLTKLFQDSINLTTRIFQLLNQLFKFANLVLIDGKIELGVNKNNQLCLIDSFGPDEFRALDETWFNGARVSQPVYYDKQLIRNKLKSTKEEGIDQILKLHGQELISRYRIVINRLQQASDELCNR